jgi:hypothetical protein
MGKNRVPAEPKFNLTIQTLQVAHRALATVPKNNAYDMMLAAQAMSEIEGVLSALPKATPVEPASEEAQEPELVRKGKK